MLVDATLLIFRGLTGLSESRGDDIALPLTVTANRFEVLGTEPVVCHGKHKRQNVKNRACWNRSQVVPNWNNWLVWSTAWCLAHTSQPVYITRQQVNITAAFLWLAALLPSAPYPSPTHFPLLSSQLTLCKDPLLVTWNYALFLPTPKPQPSPIAEIKLFCFSAPWYSSRMLQNVGLLCPRGWASHLYNLQEKWKNHLSPLVLFWHWFYIRLTLLPQRSLGARLIGIFKASTTILHLKALLGTC